MRRTVTFIAAAVASMTLSAKNTTVNTFESPDFAFPQTVAKNAEQAYSQFTAKGDGLGQLRALMQITCAESSRDAGTLQPAVTRILDCAHTQANTQIAALMNLYAATVAQSVYMNNSWQFNRRNDLPLTPRPADMTEWSGDMFNAYTDSLLHVAWAGRGNMPIDSLGGVIEYNDLSARYYPTLAYAMGAIIRQNFNQNSADSKLGEQILVDLLATTPAGSPAWYNLRSMQIVGDDRAGAIVAERLLALYDSAANPTAAAVVWYWLLDNGENPYKGNANTMAFVDKLRRVQTQLRGMWVEPAIANRISSLLNPTVSINAPGINPIGQPVALTVNNFANVSKLRIEFDRYASADNRKIRRSVLGAKITKTFDLGPSTPQRRDTTLYATLPAGYYRARIYADGATEKANSLDLQVSELNFAQICFGSESYLLLTDAATGRPVGRVKATLTENSRKAKAKTVTFNSDGLLPCNGSARQATLTYNGIVYTYNIYIPYSAPRNSRVRASLTTDIGIYHPGDTVRFMGVAMNDSLVADNVTMQSVLFDTESNPVDTVTTVTDTYGRFTGQFPLPAVISKTGRFSITAYTYTATVTRQTAGAATVMVSDFKLAGARISDLVAVPNPADSTATVTGKLATYSGVPVTSAQISLKLSGYAADTTAVAVTDADGRFSAAVPYPPYDRPYRSQPIQLTLAASATSPDGETVSATDYFNSLYPCHVVIATDPDNHSDFDVVKPVTLRVSVLDNYDKPVDCPLSWSAVGSVTDPVSCRPVDRDTVYARGTCARPGLVDLNLSGLSAGLYRLRFQPTDTAMAAYSERTLELYNSTKAALPYHGAPIWAPRSEVTASGDSVDIYMGVAEPGTYVNIFYVNRNGQIKHMGRELGAGYQNVRLDVSDLNASEHKIVVCANRGRQSTLNFNVTKPVKDRLTVSVANFRDKATASSRESWTVSVASADGAPVQSAILVSVYDQRTNTLARPTGLIIQPSLFSYTLQARTPWIYTSWFGYTRDLTTLAEQQFVAPKWLYTPTLSNIMRYRIRGTGLVRDEVMLTDYAAPMAVASKESAMATNDAIVEEAAVADEAPAGLAADLDGDAGTAYADLNAVELRTQQRRVALWRPDITTGADGRAAVDFTLPNENTTWAVRVAAWTHDLRLGRLDTTLVTSKPVMVSINAPRFVRQGDKILVMANVRNNTDAPVSVDALLDACGADTVTVIDKVTQTYQLDAHASDVLQLAVDVPLTGNVMFVTMRASTGGYSDGERHSIPVLASQSRVTEAVNFYLNPTDSVYTTRLPSAKGQDFSATLNYTGNPMWTVVEALPALTSADAFPTANSQAARYFAAAVARGMMDRHPELGYTFDRAKLDAAMADARSQLMRLQARDGGMRWGLWSTESSLWATQTVLDIFSTLIRAGYMPADSQLAEALNAAVRYCDSHVRNTDLAYTILRPTFKAVPQSLNGEQVTDRTIQYILANWRKFGTAAKAHAAVALQLNGNANTARLLLSSISQSGTQTPHKGLEFKNVRSLLVYAQLLEAYATVDKSAPEIDGIRQYLIVRRQATDWGNSLVTSWIVQSMVDSGTPWADRGGDATVTVDGRRLDVNADNRMGQFSVPVSGRRLTITRTSQTPAYGSVVAVYTAPMDQVKAFSDGEISVQKSFMVERNGRWVKLDKRGIALGDKVRVTVTVKTDRPMSNVIVTDERAATFEPVVQTPGYVYADAVTAYRENRDAVTNLYIDYLPKGTYLFQYDVRSNNAGTFSSGVATAICSQAPSLTAHSAGTTITVSE